MRNALAALFLSLQPSPPADVVNEQCFKTCTVSEAGVTMVQAFEGYSPFVYKDTAGYDTIGNGHLIIKGEHFQVPLLPEQATDLLKKDMAISQRAVNKYVLVDLWQSQFDALNSWTFNLGSGKLRDSTMLKYVNAGRDDDVPTQMNRYVLSGGKRTPGLVVRREAEGVMYMRDVLEARESK